MRAALPCPCKSPGPWWITFTERKSPLLTLKSLRSGNRKFSRYWPRDFFTRKSPKNWASLFTPCAHTSETSMTNSTSSHALKPRRNFSGANDPPRLELHWLQTDLAVRLNTSSTTISNWERGRTIPARRMAKRIPEFLDHAPARLVPKYRNLSSPCQICRISPNSPERCLFENACNQFISNEK